VRGEVLWVSASVGFGSAELSPRAKIPAVRMTETPRKNKEEGRIKAGTIRAAIIHQNGSSQYAETREPDAPAVSATSAVSGFDFDFVFLSVSASPR